MMNKLLFSKILRNLPHLFLVNKTFRSKNVTLVIPDYLLYFVALHLKLSSSLYNSQLVDIFAYENPVRLSSIDNVSAITGNSVLVYHFHNLFCQTRMTVFSISSRSTGLVSPKSISEIFATAAWLEREVGELHGLSFEGKKDLRNLMLQYGDSSAPFRKSYPSIGAKELSYDSVTDTLVQIPVTTQI